MKKLKKITVLLFLGLLVNCSVEDNSSDLDKGTQVQLPDVISLLEKTQNKNRGFFDFFFTSEADFIDAKSGCYTVNVRVYLNVISSGQKSLVASQNVKVGDCPKEARRIKENPNECSRFSLKNGDTFYSDGIQTAYCMSQLIKYDVIYNNYIESIDSLLNINRNTKE